MANHKSAEKRARQTLKRTAVNRVRRKKVRTAVKAAENALAGVLLRQLRLTTVTQSDPLAAGGIRECIHGFDHHQTTLDAISVSSIGLPRTFPQRLLKE